MENLPRSTVATKDVLYLVINRVRKVSFYFGGHWANSHHEHNTFAAIKGGLNLKANTRVPDYVALLSFSMAMRMQLFFSCTSGVAVSEAKISSAIPLQIVQFGK